MRTTVEYLDALKRRYGIVSDYGLAKLIGCVRQSISNYRAKRSTLDPLTAARVAKLLDAPVLQVIAHCEAERARSPAALALWQKVAAEAGAAAPRPAPPPLELTAPPSRTTPRRRRRRRKSPPGAAAGAFADELEPLVRRILARLIPTNGRQ